MVGVYGLRAYVFTLHQTSLAVALGIALLATIAVALLLRSRGARSSSGALAAFFVTTWAVAHVALSLAAGFAPLTVEVIRLDADEEDPPRRSSSVSRSILPRA